jgi:putative transposase
LKDAPVHPLQHALKDLERAYRNFFAQRAKFPRFKRKGRSESFRFPDAKQFQIDQVNSRIKLPKLGWVRYRNSREVLGVPRNITVSESAAASGTRASRRCARLSRRYRAPPVPWVSM